MVLQLKRFTATGNKSYTSKINDYIPTPFTISCFCSQCMGQDNPPPPSATSPGSTQGTTTPRSASHFAILGNFLLLEHDHKSGT